jgi:hypothetical protein
VQAEEQGADSPTTSGEQRVLPSVAFGRMLLDPFGFRHKSTICAFSDPWFGLTLGVAQ